MNKVAITLFALWVPVTSLAADAAKRVPPPTAATQPTQAQTQTPAKEPPTEAEIANLAEYRRCLNLARSKPDEGYEEALAWNSMGGGEASRHCAAIARINQKQYADGAKRLETLARESHQEPNMRAEMLAQAAQAWSMDNNYDQANADQVSALALNPDQPDLLVDHAVTLGQVHHYKEAIAELDKVLKTRADRIDALILRASAYRYLDDRKSAHSDIERVLAFDPGNPEALVERGILRRLDGDTTGARTDWMTVIKTVPSGPTLDEAQRNLELMDVKGETAPGK